MKLATLTADHRCANCGSDSLTLAQDCTEYLPVSRHKGRWVIGEQHFEYTDAPESVRLFCDECGTYHALPDDMPTQAATAIAVCMP